MTNQELLQELLYRFPGITDNEEEINGSDAVDALCQWVEELEQSIATLAPVLPPSTPKPKKGKRT